MFIFAILFFSTCSDAGVFDPIINRILKFTGEDPVKVCIGTFLIGCICHLDGSGATTFLIAIPACMPLFQKLKMNLWVEATIVAAGRRHHECYALGRPHSPCSRSHVWPGL